MGQVGATRSSALSVVSGLVSVRIENLFAAGRVWRAMSLSPTLFDGVNCSIRQADATHSGAVAEGMARRCLTADCEQPYESPVLTRLAAPKLRCPPKGSEKNGSGNTAR